MLISSSTFFSSPLSGILDQQSSIAKLTQQISTGNKLLTAADDPVAASQVMSLNDQVSISTQYAANQQSVGQVQSEESTILAQIQSDMKTVQQTVSAVNGSTDQDLKDNAAATLSGLYRQIKDLANSKDTNGNYIFAGFKTNVQPYSHNAVYDQNGPAVSPAPTSPATTYQGDSGLREVQIGQNQTVQANDSLQSVLQPGSTSDLLKTIDQAASDLKNQTNSTTLHTALSNASSILGTAMSSIQSLQASLAARQRQVSNQQTMTQQMQNTSQDALSNLTLVDQASTIVELQMRQTSLQAAENAFATTSKLSLFNYL